MGADSFVRLLGKAASEPCAWLDGYLRFAPGRAGILLRRLWMRHQLAHVGPTGVFAVGTVVECGKNISIGDQFSLLRYSTLSACGGVLRIGDRVSINTNVLIDASDGGEIIIGNDVLIGPNVVLRASNHVFSGKDTPINRQGHAGGRIVVGDDVWLGANVVVVPGATVGAHAVIAAGAVVTHDVEPWTVAGGVPAAPLARR
jgi:galactoside O-acetyltransferase